MTSSTDRERDLRAFVKESNQIEGMTRVLPREVRAHEHLLALGTLDVQAVEEFVAAVAPGHYLRRAEGVNVRVGRYIAPPGGYSIQVALYHLIQQANERDDPYHVHCAYETLHPFTDGNGRSGRAIWLWMVLNQGRDPYALKRGFLHTFYYQALNALEGGGE